jgi:hypothetical protein
MSGTDIVGTTTLNLPSSSLAPTTYTNYDSGMRQFAAFCHHEGIRPLHATTHSIVHYTVWLELQGTVTVASLQQNYSAVNNFFPRPPRGATRRRESAQALTTRRLDATTSNVSLGLATPASIAAGTRPPPFSRTTMQTLDMDTGYTKHERKIPGYPCGLYKLRDFHAEQRPECAAKPRT